MGTQKGKGIKILEPLIPSANAKNRVVLFIKTQAGLGRIEPLPPHRQWEIKMKRLILVVTAVLILALGIAGCEQIAGTERPDLPDYTADQVIAVAQAQYPPYDHPNMGTLSPSISVEYIGESIWRVYISFPLGYGLGWEYAGSNITLYFNETTGALSLTQPD